MNTTRQVIEELESCGNRSDAVFLQRFFKTGPGEYGEGDRFLGVRMPAARAIVKKHYKALTIDDIQTLLDSKWHEVRIAAVIAMNMQYPKSAHKQELYKLYIHNIGRGINNWDLIDISCPHIVGAHLFDKDHAPLYELAQGGLWHKRVAIISTFYFLREDEPVDTYKLAEILVNEKHDLLHKAVGWALREMGKKEGVLLRQFLDDHAATMPRTALRYALEKLPDAERKHYMQLKVNG